MTGSKGGSSGQCARSEARKTEETGAGLAPCRDSSAKETKAVVQGRGMVHVAGARRTVDLELGPVAAGRGYTTGQLVPGEGTRNDEAGNVAIPWGSADSVRSGWVRESWHL